MIFLFYRNVLFKLRQPTICKMVKLSCHFCRLEINSDLGVWSIRFTPSLLHKSSNSSNGL